ncbi:MAG: 2-hydroxyacyl-CoA dehydratase family protein, partial [Bdellovibrionota bacterium]
SVGPSEILTAMGFQVYYPENHGALLGATRASADLLGSAHALGYSQDICSYLTSDIGSYLKKETPLTKAYGVAGPPKPDLLVYATNQCHEVQDWFSFYAREWQVPIFGINFPWKVDEVQKEHIDCVTVQFQNLIELCQKISKKKLDPHKLKEVVELSAQTSKLWRHFLESAKAAPSPMTFFDSCIQMAPAVVLRGLPIANQYYQALNLEMQAKVKAKEAAIPGEKIRLYWDGMPIWGRLRFFSDFFKNNYTNIVASTYCSSWIFDNLNGDDPLNSMALDYTKIFINRSEKAKEKMLAELARDFQVAGIIFHDSKTCPYNSNSRFGMPQRLQKQYAIPSLVIDGDLCDLRCFSEEQTKTSLESFLEQLQ